MTSTPDWQRVFAGLENDTPSPSEVSEALASAIDVSGSDAYAMVDDAIAAGDLVEDPDAGLWGVVSLPDADADADEDEDEDEDEVEHEAWIDVDFTRTASGIYAPELEECERWMGRAGESGKQPFAPWGRKNPDRACTDKDCPADRLNDDECECDARWKWGIEDNYVDGETVAIAEDDPRLEGRVFIQLEDDDWAFVDGDDVRCPETGEVHPAFVALLDRLGLTYADVSTSGTGVHAYYRGELPIDGKGQATFEIDDEPWGANDDAPAVEIYANKHVNVATGEHVHGTPLDVVEWNADELRDVLESHGFEDEPEVSHDTDVDAPELEDYEPTATGRDETTDDVRDIVAAVDRLTPRDLPLRSRQVGTDSTGWELWDPSSYRSSSGNDSLHRPPGEPIFHDHKHGESFGVLSLFAAEQGIISHPWDRLAGSDWFDAVDAARESGARIPEYESDAAGLVSTLPLAKLDVLDHQERKRYARRHGFDWPSTSKVRDRLEDEILTAVRSRSRTVIDAPTSVGKSHTVATTPWLNYADVTGEQPVVHFHKTRDARDAAAQASSDANVSYRVLKGRKERCPVAAGDHDPNPDGEDPDVVITMNGQPAREWLDAVCDGKGVPFSVAHTYLAENNDQGAPLPCEHDDTDCPAVAQWQGIPRTENGATSVDVIHASHEFARVPSLIDGCITIVDEQPDFTEDLQQNTIRRAITAYLKAIASPVSTFEELVNLATPFDGDFIDLQAVGEKRRDMDDAIETDPSLPWYLENDDAHALAPALTRAVWRALRDDDPDQNGRRRATVQHEPPRFDDYGDDYLADRVTVVIDDEFTVQTVRVTPWFEAARSVVGLDAHPSMRVWQQNTVADVDRTSLMDPTERQLWRRFERGLTVVQVGDATRPFTSGEYFDEAGTRAVLEHLRGHYGREFSTCITAASVERRSEKLMKEVGISDPELMHYGEEKSRNDFADESVGLVNGCIDPGDDYVLNLIAECGLDAAPAFTDCGHCDGTGECAGACDHGECHREVDECGACNGTGRVREHGRTFTGPDADAAADLLASVRENHVAQAAARYARDADDPENSAIVFVRTDAVPPELVDIEAPGVEWVYTELQADIVDVLRESPDGATTAEIADELDCTKEHVRQTLQRIDAVEREKGVAKYGADVYDVADAAKNGAVDLSLDDVAALCDAQASDDGAGRVDDVERDVWAIPIVDRITDDVSGATRTRTAGPPDTDAIGADDGPPDGGQP